MNGQAAARPAGRRPARSGRWRAVAAVLASVLALAAGLPACSLLEDTAEDAATDAAATTGPPPGASQPSGPPLATATASPTGPVVATDPASVAADCFARWQSYDTAVDDGPTAGVERARDCFTEDFAAQLLNAPDEPDAQARLWAQLVAAGARSSVEVLASSPAGGVDTSLTGRVVLVLNVRRVTEEDGTQPVTAVSTPALTLLRQPDGSWLVAGADLSHAAGDAPGR